MLGFGDLSLFPLYLICGHKPDGKEQTSQKCLLSDGKLVSEVLLIKKNKKKKKEENQAYTHIELIFRYKNQNSN